jgi:hypothetical protein
MSERDDKRNYARVWFVMYNIFLLLALIVALAVMADSELRDLQRRVAELEQRR